MEGGLDEVAWKKKKQSYLSTAQEFKSFRWKDLLEAFTFF